MRFEGGCYCRKIRYVADGEPRLKAQCQCQSTSSPSIPEDLQTFERLPPR